MRIETRAQPLLDLQIGHFRQVLKDNGSLTITVKGTSMWPSLISGDMVTFVPVRFKDIACGDIVFTYAHGSALCHRVFRKSSTCIQTKPDAFPGFDCSVSQDEIIGKVTTRTRDGKEIRLDKGVFPYANRIIVWVTFVLAFFYPFLRFVRHRIIRKR